MSYFPEVSTKVPYLGRDSKDPLAFRIYDASAQVGDRTMAEHLRFGVAYWHTMRGDGTDPFGAATRIMPWNAPSDPREREAANLDAFFEFVTKLGVGYWCFHDRDLAYEGENIDDSARILERMVGLALKKQQETGVKLLWGTANLFSHPRFQAGASTNPDPAVFAYAAAQVKHAMAATQTLGGEGYTFWGGREGYDTLNNTNLKQEREQFARLLWMAVDYAREIGFKGQFYIEPKPMEPTKHQYDSDTEACLNFLREFGLMDHLKLNLETNHATLAGHDMAYELRAAREAGALGSVDANTGDPMVGWDTDQFPTDVYLTTAVMGEILAMGGFTTGGLNFDAKVRRQSIDPVDLFHAHVGAMDAFARGLQIAHAIREDGRLAAHVSERYAGWQSPFGQKVLAGQASFAECEAFAKANGEPVRHSGRQEMLENLINQFIL